MATDNIDVAIQREKLLGCYANNITDYLMSINGIDESRRGQVIEFVKQTTMDKLQRPKITYVAHRNYGDAELAEGDLLDFIQKASTKVITPSGSIYETLDKKRSFLTEMIEDRLALRKSIKNQMLKLLAQGKTAEAKLADCEQGTVKIGINSLIGAMGSPFNCFYDLAGFNSVTSISRNSIKLAYAHTERFLEGNFYFPNINSVINHIVINRAKTPSKEKIEALIQKFDLYVPLPFDVEEFLLSCLKKYSRINRHTNLTRLLESLKPHERAFLYYAGNMKHLVRSNGNLFKKWISEFFNEELATQWVDPNADTVEPTDLFKIDGDLVVIVATAYNQYLMGTEISDIVKNQPDLAKKLVHIGRYMQNKFNEIDELFKVFMDTKIDVADVDDHKNMYRHAVIVSDTDSVIFTTKSWIEWYFDKLVFTEESYKINSLIVYWLSKSTAFMLKHASRQKGAIGKNINCIAMKNEYFYPVMIRSALKKHYAGCIVIQEGRVLPKPKTDIKGVNFKGSNLQRETIKAAEDLLLDIINDVQQNGTVVVAKYISRIVQFEQGIISDLKSGSLRYMPIDPVKASTDYAKPESSIYFNYLFWEEIFGDKYGHINIPSKCPIIPLKPISEDYLNWLGEKDPAIKASMERFLENGPMSMKIPGKKGVSRVPIDPLSKGIPEELIPLVDIEKIVYANASPLYLAIASLGIDIGSVGGKNFLFSDIFPQ